VAPSSSPSSSTPTTPTNLQRSNARKRCVSTGLPKDPVSYPIPDLSSKRGLGGKRVLEHSAGGLEACAEPQFRYGRPSIPVLGAERRRPTEQRCGVCILGFQLFLTPTLLSSAEAAEDLRRGREKFIYNVKNSLRGGNVNGTIYDNVSVN